FVMKRLAAQNYHDANAASIKDATLMAQIQNEGVFLALRSMHVNSGMVKAFINSANGAFDLGSLSANSEMPKSITEVLSKMLDLPKDTELSNFDLVGYMQREVTSAYDRDMAKLRELAK